MIPVVVKKEIPSVESPEPQPFEPNIDTGTSFEVFPLNRDISTVQPPTIAGKNSLESIGPRSYE